MKRQIKWTEEAGEQYKKIKDAAQEAKKNRLQKNLTKASKQEGLFNQVAKTISYLGADTRHRSLNTHEYDGLENPNDKKQKVWEAYVQNNTPGAYRVFWCYGPKNGELTIISITQHP
jgi:hypothetical protein